jgi:DNA-binding NtrC family response regulator
MTEKARILFVDDEKRVLNSMRGLFRRDYDLFLTTEGAEAVRLVAENEIDVIVADQRMPGMTGIEVLGQVKKRSPRTVRILLTGYADPSAVEGSINIGEVFRFLSKPCPPQTLRDTLSLAIDASHTRPNEPVATAAPEPAPPTPHQSAPERDTSIATASTNAPEPGRPVSAPQPAETTPESAGLTPDPVETTVLPPESSPVIQDSDHTEPALQTLDEAAMEAASEESSSHWQSVTNVIMTEDSVEETQENVVLTPATSGIKDIGVVVFTIDSEFAADCIKSLSSDRNTILATTLVKVAQAIEQKNAGILVTDFTTNSAMLQKMIGALKRYLPELVTIVVSSGRDTTDMINLINHGQVYRYILKPIEPDQLRHDINAAAIQHLYLLNNPESNKRHQVIEEPAPVDSSATMNKFLGRIREIKQTRTDPTDTIT